MGKAYSEDSRDQVKLLLQQEVAEDEIEKQTGVSDRTIRRWKLELERYGRIGKPPESRTGRHRVMNKDVEQALFNHVAQKPDLSVDDMLWWLYDTYKLVVGTRTIRRAFERRNTSHKKFRSDARKDMRASKESTATGPSLESPGIQAESQEDDQSRMQMQHQLSDQSTTQQSQPPAMQPLMNTYQSPYAPMAPMASNNNASGPGPGPEDISPELVRALGGLTQTSDANANIHPDLIDEDMEISEDEETLQLQLEQIALKQRELELKLRMRKLRRTNRSSQTPRMSTDANEQSFMTDMDEMDTTAAAPSPNDNPTPNTHPGAANPSPSATSPSKHKDSRSRSKVEEAKRRTEERQERMLKDLEKRSRRREHLTAEWVQSRDVWAKGPEKLLISLMHQNSTYAYNQNSLETFENIFRSLYQLVDHTEWYPPVHDDLLRERTRRKMSQLRSKMVKSGEIVSRGEGYGGWIRSDTYIDDDTLPIDHLDQQQEMQQQEMQQQEMPQQEMQHNMQSMSSMPLDMALGGAGDARHQSTDESIVARDAMMHAPHHQNMLEHQNFQHNQHENQPYGQNLHVQEMHDPQEFGQHGSEHLASQNAMHEQGMSRPNVM